MESWIAGDKISVQTQPDGHPGLDEFVVSSLLEAHGEGGDEGQVLILITFVRRRAQRANFKVRR